MNQIQLDFERLILERNQLETLIYDYLVDPFLFITDDFWEPVIISLTDEQIDAFKTEIVETECIICTNESTFYKPLVCCNNKICVDCFKIWFKRSVQCPFCKQDLREF